MTVCTQCGASWSQESEEAGYKHRCQPPAKGKERIPGIGDRDMEAPVKETP